MTASVKFLKGDALQPQGGGNKIILNLCNVDGTWTGDFKRSLSSLWPSLAHQYKVWHLGRSANDFSVGALQLLQVKSYVYIANVVALVEHCGSRLAGKIYLPALQLGLEAVYTQSTAMQASIHFSKSAFVSNESEWLEMQDLLSKVWGPQASKVHVYELPQPPNIPPKMVANQLSFNFGA